MSKHNRRGLILGGTTLLTGGTLASLRSVRTEEETETGSARSDAPLDSADGTTAGEADSAGVNDRESTGDGTEPVEEDDSDADDEPSQAADTDDANEEPSRTAEEDGTEEIDADDGTDEATDESEDAEPAAPSLELSVSATESIAVSEGHVDFLATVRNTGAEPVSVPVAVEIEHVYEQPEALEIEPGERGDAYVSVPARSLGPGDHDWTVTAGDEVATGTATVESADDGDEGQDSLDLSVGIIDGATVRLQDGETSTRIGCEFTVFNRGADPVSTTGTLEVGGETTSIPVDLDGGESQHYREPVVVEAGDQEWTVTVGDDTESGVLHVVD